MCKAGNSPPTSWTKLQRQVPAVPVPEERADLSACHAEACLRKTQLLFLQTFFSPLFSFFPFFFHFVSEQPLHTLVRPWRPPHSQQSGVAALTGMSTSLPSVLGALQLQCSHSLLCSNTSLTMRRVCSPSPVSLPPLPSVSHAHAHTEADAKTIRKRQLKALLVSVLGFGVMGVIILFVPLSLSLKHTQAHE